MRNFIQNASKYHNYINTIFTNQQQPLTDWNEELPICAGLNFTQLRGIEELIIGDKSFNESCDDNCLDLPSLTKIQGNGNYIHAYMGYVILESMIWFDLIWFE